MDSPLDLLSLITGGGVDVLLAIACWFLYREKQKLETELRDVRSKERERMVSELKMFQELALQAE